MPFLAELARTRERLALADDVLARTYKRDKDGRFGSGGSAPDTPPVRELLHGAASDKDMAMRAVFGGKFGRYSTRVTSTGGSDGEMFVSGTIHSAHGTEIGRFSRSFSISEGKVYANHGTLELDARMQGAGFASEFNGHAVDWYRRSGVDVVALDAHTAGKYAWASQGFGFGSGADTEYHLSQLAAHVEAIRSGSTRSMGESIPRKLRSAKDLQSQLSAADAIIARAGRTRYGDPDYPTAYEISQVGRSTNADSKSDLWLGKQFMLSGPTWQGFLPISSSET